MVPCLNISCDEKGIVWATKVEMSIQLIVVLCDRYVILLKILAGAHEKQQYARDVALHAWYSSFIPMHYESFLDLQASEILNECFESDGYLHEACGTDGNSSVSAHRSNPLRHSTTLCSPFK